MSRTEAAVGQPLHLRFWGRFDSAALEEHYRRQHLPRDSARARLVLAIAFVPLLLFAVSDYRLFGTTAPFCWLLAGRTALALYTLLLLAALHKGLTPRQFDRALLGWSLLAAVLDVSVSSTRPADYTGHFLVEVVVVVLFYTVLPASLPYQAIPALLISTGSMVLFLAVKAPTDGLTGTALAVAYLLANVLGGMASWELHQWKRRQFAELEQEAALRAGLERALAEIRTLRGLLAICAHCKRVRDDAGSWHQVEVYVRERTHATFSHAICPECLQAHYGELLKP
jgi:hypothetical protein